MDALALLCNLHADGPATLQRLRRAGCETIAALRRLDPETLSAQLDWNERAAERFLREAALLCERIEVDESAAELEDPEFELESELVEELDGGDDETESEDEEDLELDAEDEDDEAGYAPPFERVEAVLGTWRELDRVAPPEDPATFVIPRPAPPLDRRLAEVQLEGLGTELAARLAAYGVRTLRELVEAQELELARALPLAYTRVRHLQLAATRELQRLTALAPSGSAELTPSVLHAPELAQPLAGFEPFTPPPAEPFETAGPFA